MFRKIFVLGTKNGSNWPKVSIYMKGSAAKQGHLYYTLMIMLAIQLVISTVATYFLKYIPEDKVSAYESIKVISRISQADINRRRQVLRSSLVARRRKKRVHPHVQFVRFPLMAIAPRLKFKCDCALPRVRRTYAHHAI